MADNKHKQQQNTSYLHQEGVLKPNEQFETIVLAEEEIETFMKKYLAENPGAEIETRYIKPAPVEYVQNVEVRWLRPETPEIPPIIIKEVDVPEDKQQTPLRIIQRPEIPEKRNDEPIIIREQPPILTIPEPKIAYVSRDDHKSKANAKEIKVEHVRSNSHGNLTNPGSRLVYDDRIRNHHNLLKDRYSVEEHTSIVDLEEEFDPSKGGSSSIDNESDDQLLRFPLSRHRLLEDEQQLRFYEEKLKQTLYEEYLLKLEREKLEQKLVEQGVIEERLRQRTISQDRSMSQNRFLNDRSISQNRFTPATPFSANSNRREYFRDFHQLVNNNDRSFSNNNNNSNSNNNNNNNNNRKPEVSSFKNIKFSRVTDENDLKRYHAILSNPNAKILSKEDAEKLTSSFKEVDQDTVINHSKNANDNVPQFTRLKFVNNSGSQTDFQNNTNRLTKTESQRRYDDDLKAYELYNNGLTSRLDRPTNSSLNKNPVDLLRNTSVRSSGSSGSLGGTVTPNGGTYKKKKTVIKSYYISNYPNSISESNFEKNVTVTNY